jgi:hypothetical protein
MPDEEGRPTNRFQFVADHQARYGVERLCRIVKVDRSSFYYWRSSAPDRAARDTADAAPQRESGRCAPRTTAPTGHRGTVRPRAGGQPQEGGPGAAPLPHLGPAAGRRMQTMIPDPAATKARALIRRNFTAAAVNERYVGDITCLPLLTVDPLPSLSPAEVFPDA